MERQQKCTYYCKLKGPTRTQGIESPFFRNWGREQKRMQIRENLPSWVELYSLLLSIYHLVCILKMNCDHCRESRSLSTFSTKPLSRLLGHNPQFATLPSWGQHSASEWYAGVPKNRESRAKSKTDFYLISFQLTFFFLHFSGNRPWLSTPTISSNLVKSPLELSSW